MLFTIVCIAIGCALAALIGKGSRPAPAPVQPVATINEDISEAVNAYAEYSIALARRADILTASAKQEKNPVKAAKLRTDAARLTAQSASQSLRAAKLARTMNY